MPTSINLPSDGVLVSEKRTWTQAMWAWMRDITAAFNSGGGFAPADATYFLRTADADLTNARVGTNSATVTLDYSTPGQVSWIASSPSAILAGATVVLTDAQIKALPTTPITLVSAQGANTRIVPVCVDLVADFTAGGYTNINADGVLFCVLENSQTGFCNGIANDSSIPLTFMTTFLTTTAKKQRAYLLPFQVTEPVANWGLLASIDQITASSYNVPFVLTGSNAGSGNWTGGNAANSLTVTAYYAVASY